MERKPLQRRTPLRAKIPMRRTGSIERAAPMPRGAPIKKMSKKREVLNAERRIAVAEVIALRPGCAWPGCNRLGEHPHEPWTRARGTIWHVMTCVAGIVMLCPEHHDRVHNGDQEEAKAVGLLRPASAGCICGFKGRA